MTTIAMSPKNDMFMSAAEDRQMRLWDVRTNVCQGLLQAPAQPCAAFDQQVSPQAALTGGSSCWPVI